MAKYRIEMYGETQLLEAQHTETERAALVAVDVMITAVHRGDHGRGCFKITADEINDLGLFQQNIFDSDTFLHPMPNKAA
jgi:hypothetical protein